jgi:dihydrofolate synthase / folylpolyglutamate synthase
MRLFPAFPTGVAWGLERTLDALAALGDPQEAFHAIHVGGTNGKGSVTATLASVLRAGGHRAAAYTSPHLCSFRERMLVDGQPLAEETLVRYSDDVRDAVVRFGLTFFEAVTVLAFHAFREEAVAVAAVEVGLGGRLDATNVLRPLVTAVTNVAMDHSDYLGETLAEIAAEKAGIMKPGVPFVTTERETPTLELFRARGREVGAPVFEVREDALGDLVVAREQTSFRLSTSGWGHLAVVTPLVGRHQAVNTALAIEVLAHLPPELRPDTRALLDGIRAVRHRGRDEVRVIGGRTWLFDVAHNTAGVESLVDTIDRLELARPLVLLIGVLGDKDWLRMLPPLFARADAAVLTVPASAPPERRWDPALAAESVRSADAGAGEVPADLVVVEDFAAGLREAASLAGTGTVVVTGSVHTVGNAMTLLGIDPLG